MAAKVDCKDLEAQYDSFLSWQTREGYENAQRIKDLIQVECEACYARRFEPQVPECPDPRRGPVQLQVVGNIQMGGVFCIASARNGRVLGLKGAGGWGNGTNVNLTTYTGHPSQQWVLEQVDPREWGGSPFAFELFRIKNVATGLYLDADKGHRGLNGYPVLLWERSNESKNLFVPFPDAQQIWHVHPLGNARYQIATIVDLAVAQLARDLDADTATIDSDDGKVQIWDARSADNQQWCFYNPVPDLEAFVDAAAGAMSGASSTYSADYAAPRANPSADGGWSPAGNDSCPFWQIDLGAPTQLDRIDLVMRQDMDQPATRRNFEIWASNHADMSESHVRLAAQGDATAPHRSTFIVHVATRIKYRYVAVVKTAPEYFFLHRVRIFSEGIDVTAGRPAEATQSSSAYAAGLGAAAALPPHGGGGWSADASVAAHSWQVNLGRPCRVVRVDVQFREDMDQPETRRNFEIRGSILPEMSLGYAVLGKQGPDALPHRSMYSIKVDAFAQYIAFVKSVPEYAFIAQIRVYIASA